MLRVLIEALVFVLVITFLRGVIGILMKAAAELFQPAPPPRAEGPSRSTSTGIGGELVRDPVCGVYVSPAVAVKKTVRGEVHYFCSEECKNKFQ